MYSEKLELGPRPLRAIIEPVACSDQDQLEKIYWTIDHPSEIAHSDVLYPLDGLEGFYGMVAEAEASGGGLVVLRSDKDGADSVVGYVCYSFQESQKKSEHELAMGHLELGKLATIESLIISDAYQDRGYGKLAMSYVEQVASMSGCSLVALITSPFGAQGFYQSLGYEIQFVFPVESTATHYFTMSEEEMDAYTNEVLTHPGDYYLLAGYAMPIAKKDIRYVLVKCLSEQLADTLPVGYDNTAELIASAQRTRESSR